MGKKSRIKRERRLGTITLGEGSRRRTVDLHPEAAGIMKQQEAAFVKKFGRAMGPDDPIFFDPDSETPQPFPEERYRREFNEAIAKVAADGGLPPEIVYAMRKTGMVVSESNWDKLLPEDREAWTDAIEEYFEKIENTVSQ